MVDASLTTQQRSGTPVPVLLALLARGVLTMSSNARVVQGLVTTEGALTPTDRTPVCVSQDIQGETVIRSMFLVSHRRVFTEGGVRSLIS